MKIRPTTDSDRAAISGIYMDAFGQDQGPEIIELVTGLLNDETAKPLLSLVAEDDGKIVAHILFSRVRVQPEHKDADARILAPLAVTKDFQGQGVGGSLIKEGLKQLTESGVALVFVLGHQDYYPNFGFQPAGVSGFEAPYSIPLQHTDAWMVQALRAGVIGDIQGKIQCSDTLDQPQHWRE